MSKSGSVSVAMCTYNGARFLLDQLSSIALQTRPPDELVICDDGSTDKTLAIVTRYAGTVEFPVRVHRNSQRLGPAKNFEQALSLCRGDIVALSDQDDVWRPEKLRVLEEALCVDDAVGYAFSDAVLVDETGRLIHRSLWERVGFDRSKRIAFSRGPSGQAEVLFRGNVVTGATMALKAQLRAMIPSVPELWMHDEWIVLSCSVMGIRGVPVARPLISYREHQDQVAGARRPSRLRLIGRSLVGERRTHEAAVDKWRAAHAVLQQVARKQPDTLALLEGKVAHVALRAGLWRRPRRARVAAIAAELARGRYHSCSGGLRSAIKDALVSSRSSLA